MLIVDKHCSNVSCDEFPVPQIDRKSKQVKNSDMENFICKQYGEQLAIINYENIKSLWMNNKVSGDKYANCLHFFHICFSSPPLVNIQVMVIVLMLRGNIVRTALCRIV